MISKILVATDGSSNAIRGAEKALEFAKAIKAEVMLVYVAYVPIMYRSDISDNLKESFVEDGKRILQDTEQVF
ncbi:MAG: universal stress protein [Candidatus Cloacimonadota bacterium]|nr:MAG: universal stress protein [Candidatus Cloacimonadota bacterium]